MKYIYIFVFSLMSFLSFAQWNRVEEIKSPLVYCVLFDGDNIFVGTDSLYISRNRGLTWESTTVNGNPVEITAFLKVDDKILAGTYGEGIYQSTDGGVSWEPQSNGLSTWAKYAKLFVLSGDTIFYGSDGGGIYFRTLNSSVWQSFNQNLPSNIAWSIKDIIITDSNIIASAGASGYYYLRPKGSSEWTDYSLSTPSGLKSTPNVFLDLGDTLFLGCRFGIFRSVNEGYNWDSVGVRALPLDVVSLVKDKNRIYAGFTRLDDFFVWYSDDLGDTWNSMHHEFQYLHELYIYDNKIWAATGSGLWYTELNPNGIEPIEKPEAFLLEQNYPNPFNPVTRIKYSVPSTDGHYNGSLQTITLKVYDILGTEVAVLVNEEKAAGEYEVGFNASGLSSGTYFYQLKVFGSGQTFSEMKKMILLK